MLKAFLPVLFFLFGTCLMTYAQSERYVWAAGIHLGGNMYMGDLRPSFTDFSADNYVFGGASLALYLNPSFDVVLNTSFGRYGYEGDRGAFLGNKADYTLLLNFKTNNGYILPVESRLTPFLIGGFGLATYRELAGREGMIDDHGADLLYSYGLGLRYIIHSKFAVVLQSIGNFTNNDKRDMYPGNNNDHFFRHSLGWIILLDP